MSYGLYDADLPYYPIPFYNLELMKLSSFYKRKREIVGLAPSFSPERYSNFIVRQDFYNPYAHWKPSKHIVFGGRAFDGETYKPLPPEVECMKADISLYSRIKPEQVRGRNITALNTMRRAEHIRLSLDSKTVWNDFEKQLRHDSDTWGIIFHDYNLNSIENAQEIITDLLPRSIQNPLGRRIGMKFPVQVNNKEDMVSWLSFQPMGTYFSLYHNGLVDESYIPELVDVAARSGAIRQSSVNISNSFTDNELLNGGLQRILRNIINLRSYRLVFPLKYDKNWLIGSDWKLVMDLIARYNQHLVINYSTFFFNQVEPYETMYSYCKAAIKQPRIKDEILTKESLQHIFQFVRENDYDLFKDFYEYRGGEVKNDR